MAKEMTYEEVRSVDRLVYDLLKHNPIGEYNRIEDIFDMVLFEADDEAMKALAEQGKERPDSLKDVRIVREPYMLKYYMDYVDADRDALLEELKKRGINNDEALDAFKRALEKIRKFDEKKELMNMLAEDAYEKCVFNLILYEFLKK